MLMCMKRLLLSSILLIVSFYAVKAQDHDDSEITLNAIKQVIEEEKGTFPRELFPGLTWDSLALVGKDFTYFCSCSLFKNNEDKFTFNEAFARKFFFGTLAKGCQDMLSYLVDADLNLVLDYTFEDKRPNLKVRITTQEIRDFLSGDLVVTPKEALETLYTNFRAMLPIKYEDGSTLDNIEMRNGIFAMYYLIENSTLLNQIELVRDEVRVNLKNLLSSPMFLSLCMVLKEAHNTLAIVYHCGNRKATFAFSPTDLEEIVNESTLITDYNVLDKEPEFPGGINALMTFIIENLRYPSIAVQNGWEGRVTLSFVVEKDGSISDITEEKSPYPVLTEEAIRVVKMLPRWEPGYANGQPVRVKYFLPVTFRL